VFDAGLALRGPEEWDPLVLVPLLGFNRVISSSSEDEYPFPGTPGLESHLPRPERILSFSFLSTFLCVQNFY
jgi:hypothetical protein